MTRAEVNRAHREEFYGALKNNDFAKLSEIYAEDYMLVRFDGSVFSKTQILDELKAHSVIFRSIELANEKIRIHGTVGILTGDSDTVTVRDGKESKTRFRLVAIYADKMDTSSSFIFRAAPFLCNLDPRFAIRPTPRARTMHAHNSLGKLR